MSAETKAARGVEVACTGALEDTMTSMRDSDERAARATIRQEGSTSMPGTLEFATASRALDSRSLGYRFVKRVFDIVFSACVCTVGLVPGAVLCILIAAETKGAPIYAHERAGRYGKPIRVLKFRSMVADADNVEKWLTSEQMEEWHRERKVTDDPRITRLGCILRKTSLDELPQFLNVLLGQISIIGPRAITYEELGNFTPEQQLALLSIPQGITGAWQSGPRNLATFENGLRQKFELTYVRDANVKTDWHIFFKTFFVMFGKNKNGR